MATRPRRISDIKPLLTNLAQTSHYEVKFGTLPVELRNYLNRKGIDSRFIADSAGLLCYNASLPTTSFATSDIFGNYTGINEKFAHTRTYQEITLDFYVDNNYQMLKFLESWMEFMSSGSSNNIGLDGENAAISPNVDNYFIRMQYPAYYKANSVKILKFDRDYKREIEYNFRGLFPVSMSSIPVSYVSSDTLKVSASFQYDRYIAGKTNSINESIFGDNNNQNPTQSNSTNVLRSSEGALNNNSPQSAEEFFKQSTKPFTFSSDTSGSLSQTANNLKLNPLSSQSNTTEWWGKK